MILPIDIFQDGYNHQPVSIESGFPGNEGNEGNDGLTGVLAGESLLTSVLADHDRSQHAERTGARCLRCRLRDPGRVIKHGWGTPPKMDYQWVQVDNGQSDYPWWITPWLNGGNGTIESFRCHVWLPVVRLCQISSAFSLDIALYLLGVRFVFFFWYTPTLVANLG